MPSFNIAHVRERTTDGHEVDLIIIPLESTFGQLTQEAQQAQIAELQARAIGADLAGKVYPVWDAENRRMAFIALQQWHPYFSSLSLDHVAASLNRTLSW